MQVNNKSLLETNYNQNSRTTETYKTQLVPGHKSQARVGSHPSRVRKQKELDKQEYQLGQDPESANQSKLRSCTEDNEQARKALGTTRQRQSKLLLIMQWTTLHNHCETGSVHWLQIHDVNRLCQKSALEGNREYQKLCNKNMLAAQVNKLGPSHKFRNATYLPKRTVYLPLIIQPLPVLYVALAIQ